MTAVGPAGDATLDAQYLCTPMHVCVCTCVSLFMAWSSAFACRHAAQRAQSQRGLVVVAVWEDCASSWLLLAACVRHCLSLAHADVMIRLTSGQCSCGHGTRVSMRQHTVLSSPPYILPLPQAPVQDTVSSRNTDSTQSASHCGTSPAQSPWQYATRFC